MDVRIWGVSGDRLIELCADQLEGCSGMRVAGLPQQRARTTADRVRAALLNAGVLSEAPPVLIRAEPSVTAGSTSELDLAIALAALASAGGVGVGLRWIFAEGRLGLDGAVYAEGIVEGTTLADVVGSVAVGSVVVGPNVIPP